MSNFQMSEEEYLKERLLDEIQWYSKKSARNKAYYQWLKILEIIISVTIPFLTGYLKERESLKYLIGALGLALAFIAGLLVLFRFQEKWIEYRNTNESLKHEKFLFVTKSGPYKTDGSLSDLVERVENLISRENSNWTQFVSKKTDEQ